MAKKYIIFFFLLSMLYAVHCYPYIRVRLNGKNMIHGRLSKQTDDDSRVPPHVKAPNNSKNKLKQKQLKFAIMEGEMAKHYNYFPTPTTITLQYSYKAIEATTTISYN
ncbi:uncharacterized protein [Musca autumnalis]|uniref:uncharacterized protein n=1 Tax=Musca autumnalis TaxID=221902 RepID=UPI003CEF7789